MTVTVYVVDDEALARRKIASLIAAVPWAKQIGEAADGVTAIDEISDLRPDIVFLDIQMPEVSGIEVAERLRSLDPVPAVVFATAYDRHAVTAFELEAVDYVLKPFGQQRFEAAIRRARYTVEARAGAAALDRARETLFEPETPRGRSRGFLFATARPYCRSR